MNTTTPGPHKRLWTGDWVAGQVPSPAADEAPPPDGPDGARRRPSPAGPPPSPRRSGRRRFAQGAAAGAAVAAVAAGAFVAGGAGENERAAAPATPAPLAASAQRAPSTDVGRVYAKASPAVVSIRTGDGQGTGFLIDADGTIVTNAHVVGDATQVTVGFGEDGEKATGRVLGSDPSSDLAVVRVPRSAAAGVTPLTLASDATVAVGDAVVAIGNPFGLDRTATAGIVSATGRSIEAPNGFSISGAIQTDAPINPGNSGGPLLDGAGRVIGVNSQIATAGGTGSGGNVGVGFAVPTSLVQSVVPQLERGQAVRRAYLGISTGPSDTGDAVVVAGTAAGGPAATAGLQAGDRLVSVAGEAVDASEDVSAAIAGREPGDEVPVVVERDGGRETITVRLGTRPTEAP